MKQIIRSSSPAIGSRVLVIRSSALALIVAASALGAPLAAQAPDGFLFRQPMGSVGLNFGYTVPGANSELFDFVTQQLTVEPSDFETVTLGLDLAFNLTSRIDLSAEIAISESEKWSEFRDWVDLDDLPIEQVTTLRQVPLTVSAKFYFRERGTKVGNLAWIPASWSPYIGGGGGLLWYEFTQQGDFVDFETEEIFNDFLRTDGRATVAHGFAGLDYSLSPRVVVSGEGRYTWGKGEMGRDFVNFDDLDLSGFRVTAGFKLRF